jgi:broad specificity phosphatase PhoE
MAKTLLLLRHAQTTSNVSGRYMGRTDEELSDMGLSQASRLAERLSHWPITEVYSSPLKRALSTAEAVALPHGLSVGIEDELIEIDLGQWRGMFGSDIATRYPALWKTWRTDPTGFEPPGGESLAKVQQRATAAMERIAASMGDKTIAFVTHDVAVRLLVAHCLDVPASIYRRLEIANASLTVVEGSGHRWRLRLLNDTAHLGDDVCTSTLRQYSQSFTEGPAEV